MDWMSVLYGDFISLTATAYLLRWQRTPVSYLSFHVGYIYSIDINLTIIWASTRILRKVSKEIKSRSTKRLKNKVPVLYFCSVLTDRNKQSTENQFRCLTTTYKGIKQMNLVHSYQNENKLHGN